MNDWIEFEMPGALEFIDSTELISTINGIEIRYADGLHHLLAKVGNKYYLGTLSHVTRERAEFFAKHTH